MVWRRESFKVGKWMGGTRQKVQTTVKLNSERVRGIKSEEEEKVCQCTRRSNKQARGST